MPDDLVTPSLVQFSKSEEFVRIGQLKEQGANFARIQSWDIVKVKLCNILPKMRLGYLES